MMPIVPAMNTLWFWFDKSTRRKLHGTPTDVMRKFNLLDQNGLLTDGIEIYLDPSQFNDFAPFDTDFYKRFARLPFRSVHIGNSDIDFLDQETILDSLAALSKITQRLEAEKIIIHAHHLKDNRTVRYKTLTNFLSDHEITIENNGFDNKWGASPEAVAQILNECPNFKFCMDIAHINDFQHIKLSAFTKIPIIMERLSEIHFSYSTRLLPKDPYIAKGYSGYGPYHALFSVVEKNLSESTKTLIKQYPVVIEGILPKEDQAMDNLKKERQIITSEAS
ncbi:hypothetical protein [uncultured Desulfobacter sp.]|uniref:hypothetical protein n=1 Tax=uncultured Desulfobacter sp. TaxID=240139 RepID=UPI0029C76E41|nr:hypothetical protein [uncultured Desulfobacter sp.]